MKKSKKIGLCILSGGIVTMLDIAKRYCKVKAKNSDSKFYSRANNMFDFVGNWVENIMAIVMVVGMFV